MSRPISRRQFWKVPLKDATKAVLMGRGAEPEPEFIRPPGALEESEFLEKCLRCAACVAACPFDAISEAGATAGVAEATPVLNPEQAPCHWCSSWDCINVCESGALVMPEDGKPKPIAKARIERHLCLVSQGILCDECIVRCPSEIGAMGRDGLFPKLDVEACTGCGLCAYYCQAEEGAVRVRSTR